MRTNFENYFTKPGIQIVIQKIKTGKAVGPEFLNHCEFKTCKWLAAFFTKYVLLWKVS